MSQTFEYAGNIHIHTHYSDGTGTVPEIIRAGQRAGLDFLIITDHRTMAAKSYQGWHDRLLVMVGEELGSQHGHYLGLGLDEPCRAEAPQAMIDEVRSCGGAGFIAHPHDEKFPWPDWTVTGFDGLSLWNMTSQWRWSLNPLTFLPNLLFPGRAITSPPQATREKWDELNRGGRPVPVIGCSDAHAFGFRPLGLPLVLLPYRFAFRAVCTHVLLSRELTGDNAANERSIIDALRAGSCFIANHLRGRARGFRFTAEGVGRTWGMGQTVPPGAVERLTVSAPAPAGIVLLRDGREAAATYGDGLTFQKPPPGIYRVEVYKDEARKWGWIFSNAIRVG